jgi:monoamine oxidase
MRGSGGIWRALEQARNANLTAMGAAPARIARAGITRRHLLAGLGASAAVPFLPRSAFAAPNPRIVVIGGGLAGLTALDALAQAGLEATLYEARGAVGGRIRTNVGALGEGLAVDDGGQLVNSDHEDVRALCKRLGLTLADRQSAPSRGLVLDGGRVVPQADLVAALRPLAARITADADRMDANVGASAAFDRMSVAQYLDRAGARGFVRTLLESTIRTEYGIEPEQASAIEMLWNLPTIDGERLEVLGNSDERYAITGGSQRLTDALAGPLADRIRTRSQLVRIGYAGSGLSLSFADGIMVEADRVIVTVPASLYRSIKFDVRLPQVWRSFLDEVDLGRVEKLVVGCATRPWLKAFGPAGEVWAGPGFAEAWDATGGQPELVAGALAFLPGGAQIDDFARAKTAALAERWVSAAENAVPGLRAALNGRTRRTAWHQDPFSRGSYVAFRPGQLTRFAPIFWGEESASAGHIGRLFFAGEHMSADFPGYMNGAAETGRRAAETIIAQTRMARAA